MQAIAAAIYHQFRLQHMRELTLLAREEGEEEETEEGRQGEAREVRERLAWERVRRELNKKQQRALKRAGLHSLLVRTNSGGRGEGGEGGRGRG